MEVDKKYPALSFAVWQMLFGFISTAVKCLHYQTVMLVFWQAPTRITMMRPLEKEPKRL